LQGLSSDYELKYMQDSDKDIHAGFLLFLIYMNLDRWHSCRILVCSTCKNLGKSYKIMQDPLPDKIFAIIEISCYSTTTVWNTDDCWIDASFAALW